MCPPWPPQDVDELYRVQHELLLSRVKACLTEHDGRRLGLVVASVLRVCFDFIRDDAPRARLMLIDGPRRQFERAGQRVAGAEGPNGGCATLTDPRLSAQLRSLLQGHGYRMDDAHFDALFSLARRAAMLWSERGCITPVDELVRLHVYAWRCIRHESRLSRASSVGRGPRLVTV
ncbi:MAG: hypothetical protein QM742_18915 [Aquabacterium sp.]